MVPPRRQQQPRKLNLAPQLGLVELSLDFDDGATRTFVTGPAQVCLPLGSPSPSPSPGPSPPGSLPHLRHAARTGVCLPLDALPLLSLSPLGSSFPRPSLHLARCYPPPHRSLPLARSLTSVTRPAQATLIMHLTEGGGCRSSAALAHRCEMEEDEVRNAILPPPPDPTHGPIHKPLGTPVVHTLLCSLLSLETSHWNPLSDPYGMV